MVEHTDLNKCKEIAIEMLDSITPVEVKTYKGTFKIVPFAIEYFSQIDCYIPVENYIRVLKKFKVQEKDIEAIRRLVISKKFEAKMSNSAVANIDTYKNNETYTFVKTMFKNLIANIKDFNTFALWIRQQYSLDYLEKVQQYISLKDYCFFVIATYIDRGDALTTFGVKTINMTLEERIIQEEKYFSSFRKTDRQYLMDTYELDTYNNLPEEVTIYRGITEFNKQHIKGISWTLDKDVAEKIFANIELNEDGIVRRSDTIKGDVYQAKIKKEDIFAYQNGRHEQEVIVDYTKLYDIKPIIKNLK